MIKIEKTEVFGFKTAIRGMRNPKNSWEMSDSEINEYGEGEVGEKDLKLMKTLAKAGTDHGKYLRMISVSMDITAPLYWWKEYDTYKVGTVANSCSTMHKISEKEFSLDMFSREHLDEDSLHVLKIVIDILNFNRFKFNLTKDKNYWWQMIQMLPTSYNQTRTCLVNYAVLRNIYHSRKTHKLDEWHDFCKWVEESLPYSELITEE